ncbi:MAG: hypothetical protein A4E64_01334 [Syntrophorhabdus sp. PtaU1.Bin058]|nr:MAG: hypothetical protein A4E64_01334 [Syntrophorhabdus sp. PtaU1.Bin058]
MNKIKNFKDLKVWQKGIEIVIDTYALTKKFPKEELYSLTTQIKRSAISIPSNIAEGFKRFHIKENKQFFYVAQASLAELETQLIIAKELDFISEIALVSLTEKIDHASKMLSSLLRKMK